MCLLVCSTSFFVKDTFFLTMAVDSLTGFLQNFGVSLDDEDSSATIAISLEEVTGLCAYAGGNSRAVDTIGILSLLSGDAKTLGSILGAKPCIGPRNNGSKNEPSVGRRVKRFQGPQGDTEGVVNIHQTNADSSRSSSSKTQDVIDNVGAKQLRCGPSLHLCTFGGEWSDEIRLWFAFGCSPNRFEWANCCSGRRSRAVDREKSVLQECPTRVSHKSVPQECPTRLSHKSILQECPTKVSHKSVPQSVPQECPRRVSYKSDPQECPTRVSYKSDPQECPTRVSHKSVPQEFPTRVTHKSVLQECPTRVSHKSVPQSVLQECPTRVSHKSVPQSVPQECPTRVSYKTVPQECPTRVSQKSVLQECPTRVSYTIVPQECPTRVSHKSFLRE